MNRRTFLAASGVVSSIGLAGCASPLDDGPPERPWPESDTVDDPEGTHNLFVENHTDATETAWLRVVRDDDAALVDGRYELPDGRAIQFDDVAAWGRTYTIDIAIDGEDLTSLAWDVEGCGRDSESPGDGGSRNAAVRVDGPDGNEGERVSLRVDECDAINAGIIPAGSPESFRLGG